MLWLAPVLHLGGAKSCPVIRGNNEKVALCLLPEDRMEAILIDMARMWERMSMELEQSHATAGISTPHIRLIASQEAANGANSNSRKDR